MTQFYTINYFSSLELRLIFGLFEEDFSTENEGIVKEIYKKKVLKETTDTYLEEYRTVVSICVICLIYDSASCPEETFMCFTYSHKLPWLFAKQNNIINRLVLVETVCGSWTEAAVLYNLIFLEFNAATKLGTQEATTRQVYRWVATGLFIGALF